MGQTDACIEPTSSRSRSGKLPLELSAAVTIREFAVLSLDSKSGKSTSSVLPRLLSHWIDAQVDRGLRLAHTYAISRNNAVTQLGPQLELPS